jgi:hypothetical protein
MGGYSTDSLEDMEDNVRLGVTISRYDLKRLKIWAMLHGRTPTAYAAQIISFQIESNFDLINRQLEDYARSRGKTVNEVVGELEGDPNE